MKVKKVNEFFKPFSKPIVKEKGAGCSTPFPIVYASVLLLTSCPPAAPVSS